MKTIVIQHPGESLPAAYFDARYTILRKPLGLPKNSEQLHGDDKAIHAWIDNKGQAISVGRAHLIPENSDGSVFDQKTNSNCPGFTPLSEGYEPLEDDSGLEIPAEGLRPAVQIRAMGTLQPYQGQGSGSKVLAALEKESISLWNMKTGWLQARIEAIPFYEANGWCCFGPEYEVPNIGQHVSMWKKF